MKKPYYLLITILLLTPLVFFAKSYGPDNPLNEDVYVFQGKGGGGVFGTGVNNTVPNTTTITLPLPAGAAVQRAYLYADFHCEGQPFCVVQSHTNATASFNGNDMGEVLPYDQDQVGVAGIDYWNIYRWDVTGIVRTTGAGTYTVTIDSPNNPQAYVGNVLLAVVFSHPTYPYRQVIINDGIEVLAAQELFEFQVTTFHSVGGLVGSTPTSGMLYVAVTGGDVGAAGNQSEALGFNGGPWLFQDDIWASWDGPSLDIKAVLPVYPVAGDNFVTVVTGQDDVGWEVALLEADLRDVSADSQTHPNAQVVQGTVEPIDVVVSNNGHPTYGVTETFDVTLYVTLGATTTAVETKTGITLGPSAQQTLTFNWDTTGWGPGTYSIEAWADSGNAILELDELNNNCTDPATLRIMTPPNADPDGPYEDYEGSPITFDASASTDQDGTIVLYEWDFDNDGSYDWSGTSSTVDYTYGDDYNGLAVLRVTDDDGLQDTDTANVLVKNVDPTVDAGPDQEALPGHHYTEFCFTGSFTDPGWLDDHTAEWDFGDGSPPVAGVVNEEHVQPDSTGTVNGVCHQYWVPYQDTYTVILTVEDDDGGVSRDTLTVTILTVVGGEELPLDVGTVLTSMLYSYLWIPTLMAIALAIVYIKKRNG